MARTKPEALDIGCWRCYCYCWILASTPRAVAEKLCKCASASAALDGPRASEQAVLLERQWLNPAWSIFSLVASERASSGVRARAWYSVRSHAPSVLLPPTITCRSISQNGTLPSFPSLTTEMCPLCPSLLAAAGMMQKGTSTQQPIPGKTARPAPRHAPAHAGSCADIKIAPYAVVQGCWSVLLVCEGTMPRTRSCSRCRSSDATHSPWKNSRTDCIPARLPFDDCTY